MDSSERRISFDEYAGCSSKVTSPLSALKPDKARLKLNPLNQDYEAPLKNPKLEVKELSDNNSTEVDDEFSDKEIQDEFWPLSDKPYFDCILAKSQVEKCFVMVIPKKIQQFLPEREITVVLACRNKKWRMTYYGNCPLKRFGSGWRSFVKDNNLRVGDGIVFELSSSSEKCINFRVQILDGDIPSEFLEEIDGETLNHPITID